MNSRFCIKKEHFDAVEIKITPKFRRFFFKLDTSVHYGVSNSLIYSIHSSDPLYLCLFCYGREVLQLMSYLHMYQHASACDLAPRSKVNRATFYCFAALPSDLKVRFLSPFGAFMSWVSSSNTGFVLPINM